MMRYSPEDETSLAAAPSHHALQLTRNGARFQSADIFTLPSRAFMGS
tara:strand:- start:655 stop:795 length:141 start_codon:yes stop_codon:yes gene_type:complete